MSLSGGQTPSPDRGQTPNATPNATGQRMLAAVVFTDAVNFSARMSEDESSALVAVGRDLELMTESCRRFDGQVVKNTGDGLMMLFTSAVQAVHCAVDIQRRLSEAARIHPDRTRFDHRVGVHLGDVVLANGDALGDGINVAARLQEHAEPGGICLSQTVFEVVRSSLAIPVEKPQRLELKNVEAVQALRIGPQAITGFKARRVGGSSRPVRSHIWIAGGIVVLAAAIAYVGYSLSEGLKRIPATASGEPPTASALPAAPPPAESPVASRSTSAAEPASAQPGPTPPARVVAPPVGEPSAPAPSTPARPAPATAPTTAPAATTAAPPSTQPATAPVATAEAPLAALRAQVEQRRLQARLTYGFGEFVEWLMSQRSTPGGAVVDPLVRRYTLLNEMMVWLRQQLVAASEQQPLEARGQLPAKFQANRAWGAGDRVTLSGAGGVRTLNWAEIPPVGVMVLFDAAIRAHPGTRMDAQRRRLWQTTFAEEYNIPLPGTRGARGR